MLRILALAALAACSKSASESKPQPGSASPPPPTTAKVAASCDERKALHACTEYSATELDLGGSDYAKKQCSSDGAVWGTAPCPTDHLIGSCIAESGSHQRFYAQGDATADGDAAKAARDACGLSKSSRWVQGPSAD